MFGSSNSFPDRNTDFGKKLFFKWDLNQNKKLEIDELPKHARKNFQKSRC